MLRSSALARRPVEACSDLKIVPPPMTRASDARALRAVLSAVAGTARTRCRRAVSPGSLLTTITSCSASASQNAAQSASSPGLPCPNAPTSVTVDIEHLLVQAGVLLGDRRPAPAARRARRSTRASSARASGSSASCSMRRASGPAVIGDVRTLGRPGAAGQRRRQQHRRAVGEGEGEHAARRERLRVREHAQVGGAEPRADVAVGHPPGEAGDVAVALAQLGAEARARRPSAGARHRRRRPGCRGAGGAAASSTSSMPLYGARKPKHSTTKRSSRPSVPARRVARPSGPTSSIPCGITVAAGRIRLNGSSWTIVAAPARLIADCTPAIPLRATTAGAATRCRRV